MIPIAEFSTVEVRSTLDGSVQPAWFYAPPEHDAETPLLVLLHTWRGGYDQADVALEALRAAAHRRWAVIQPHLRGPNNSPDACASELAVQDVQDAVAFAASWLPLDTRRLFALGASGGGQMALLLAGRFPTQWTAVSAWAPITDLAAWHQECRSSSLPNVVDYADDLERVCGGPPGTSGPVAVEYRARSPLTYLHRAVDMPVDLNAGIHDGHTGCVPISHALYAFNQLARVGGHAHKAFSADQFDWLRRLRRLPEGLGSEDVDDEHRRLHPVLLRRTAGPVRFTLFDGGHECDAAAAVRWLSRQVKPLPARTEPPKPPGPVAKWQIPIA